jgi:fructose-bisphosphate aldolase class II
LRSLREEFDFPVFLNADHTYSVAKSQEAARSGFDGPLRSALSFTDCLHQC